MSQPEHVWSDSSVVDQRDWSFFAHRHRESPIEVGSYVSAVDKIDGRGSVRAYVIEHKQSEQSSVVILTDSADGSVPAIDGFAGRALMKSFADWHTYGDGSIRRGVQSVMRICADLDATASYIDSREHFAVLLDINEVIMTKVPYKHRQHTHNGKLLT